jgi:hypothetical protein
MIALYVAQHLIPLSLCAWLVLAPSPTRVGLYIQVTAIILAHVALFLAGLWIVPTPQVRYLFLLMLVLSIWVTWRRHLALANSPAPVQVRKRATLFFSWLLLLVSTVAVGQSAAGRRMPPGPVVDLAFPLAAGDFVIVNGGSTVLINAHADALDQSVPAHRAFHGTAYGVDIVQIGSWLGRADGLLPADPSRYYIFGRPVLAPCAGQVVVAADGRPDMVVPQHDPVSIPGNYVVLRCDDVDVLLAHFRKGSVIVVPGQAVALGQPIAKVGNSGASGEPHLHVHAQRSGSAQSPFSGAPVPITFGGRYLVRNNRVEMRESAIDWSRPPAIRPPNAP